MKNLLTNKSIIALFFVALLFVSANALQAATKECKVKTNVHCGTCEGKINKGLKSHDGVLKSSVDMDTKVATVSYDSDKTSEAAIVKEIAALGYTASLVDGTSAKASSGSKCCSKDKKSCSSKKSCKTPCSSKKK
jgi:periplasmic mercuric ion binding protein